MNTKLFRITTIRPFMGKTITHIYDKYTEGGRDEYIKDITSKFGEESIVSVLEYHLVKVIK